MTTANTHRKTPPTPEPFVLPDPPRQPEHMTGFKHLTANGSAHHLLQHLTNYANPDTTLVTGERYVVVRPTPSLAGSLYPDLLVAFDVDPAAYDASNGYIIAEQGKSPDFVLEIASRRSARLDTGPKRDAYAALGVPEYWRFDETGEHHGNRLAGDRLVGGQYQPIDIDQLADGALQGYSAILNLNLRWEHGHLGWHDPATGRHIATFDSERARADLAEARARALEDQLHRLRND